VASADDKQVCLDASSQGQQLRDDGKYRAARAQLVVCAREVCPAVVKRDCTQWLGEVDQTVPTVVVRARDSKGDLAEVRVLVDGQTLLEKLDGKPAAIDPGEHVFRYEAQGHPPVEEHVVVRVGERNRLLDVQFGGAAGAVRVDGDSAKSSGPPVLAWILGGVAVLAFGSEAYFGITGLNDRSDLRAQPCAQTSTCSASDVDAIRTKFLIADVSLGVGIVSAGVAAYLFLASGKKTEPAPAAVDVRPLPGGALASVGARF
jgi:hypothetical protein